MKLINYVFLFSLILTVIVIQNIYPSEKEEKLNSLTQIDTISINQSLPQMVFKVEQDTLLNDDEDYLITKITISDFKDNKVLQTFTDTSNMESLASGVEYIDANLDGYLDIDIDLGCYNLIPHHSFWLFDKSKNNYTHSEDFSQLNDYGIDQDANEITSDEPQLGAKGSTIKTYKINGKNLELIEVEEFSDFFDYQRDILVNGKMVTDTLSLLKETEGEKGNQIITIESYKLIADSLALVEKSWLSVAEDQEANMPNNNIYNCEAWEKCLKYLYKEVYTYEIINKTNLVQKVTRYQVIKDKWQIVE